MSLNEHVLTDGAKSVIWTIVPSLLHEKWPLMVWEVKHFSKDVLWNSIWFLENCHKREVVRKHQMITSICINAPKLLYYEIHHYHKFCCLVRKLDIFDWNYSYNRLVEIVSKQSMILKWSNLKRIRLLTCKLLQGHGQHHPEPSMLRAPKATSWPPESLLQRLQLQRALRHLCAITKCF